MESLKSEVRQLINKLSDQFDHLPEGALHPLDADLMLSLLRQLYVKTEALRHSLPSSDNDTTHVRQVTQAMPLMTEQKLSKSEEIPHLSTPVIPSMEEPARQPVSSEFIPAEPVPAEKQVAPESQPHIVSEFNSESEFVRDPGPEAGKQVPVDLFGTPTIADKLKSDTPSLNDKITSGRNDLSLADRMQLKPIGDLKTAVGLNDKFQFINELFEGSTDRYTEALNLLNSCAGSNEAEMLLTDLKIRYNWSEQNPVWKKLKEFIFRRYM
jgi:hypothetical protein